MGLAGEWWFWALALAALCAALARRWPGFVVRARRWALARGLVSLPPGHTLASGRGEHDLSWLAIPIAVWVGAGPWIWGYDDSAGPVTAALATAASVLALTVAGVIFPALWALQVLAGVWLVVMPWIVGYGDDGGPVGLSDTICGLLLTAVAISALATAERRLRRGGGGIGRIGAGGE
jgi:hypothetical protein